jgi:serine/threonine protein kinase
MAEIFLARNGDTGRLVVLKKLHPRLSIEPEYVQMFHDEAVIASKMHHPNLVEVYELGLDGDHHYIAMEYLHGHDLSRTLRRMRHQRMPLLFQQAITIVRDVAAGLHYAHECIGDDGSSLNIIHRDVSPHNVVLTFTGEVKVVDFGVAKASSQIARTRTGVLKGKTAYMSPEQAMGEPLDRRTDVFSIGIMLWELTTGRWLYRRKTELETLKAVVEIDAPRPSSVRDDYPQDLEKIVMKALAREPAERWSTAGELRGALDELARNWRFRPQPQMIGKLMASAFADEVAAWEQARAAGTPLSQYLATARADLVDLSGDTIGTDPEDGIAFETKRAPVESSAPSTALPIPPPLPKTPWWWLHRRTLIFGAAALALAVVIAIVLALLTGGGGGGGSGPATSGSGSAGSGGSKIMYEELDLSRKAPDAPPPPKPEPTPEPAPSAPEPRP